jgi:predicted DNA-binding protein (MmcQ/YjbR family)
MTANDFRRIALTLPGAEEHAHMNHPDFRVAGKIFATLGYPDKSCGMVKLSPEQQHYFSKADPGVFEPVKGAWGRGGATRVHLKAAKKAMLAKALETAWRLAQENKAKKKKKEATVRVNSRASAVKSA